MREQKQLAEKLIEVEGSGEKNWLVFFPCTLKLHRSGFFKVYFIDNPQNRWKDREHSVFHSAVWKKMALAIHLLKGLVHYV